MTDFEVISKTCNQYLEKIAGLLCFWLLLGTYVFYPLYKLYKFSTSHKVEN